MHESTNDMQASRELDVHDACILVADDDPAICRLLVRVLQADGYRSVHAVENAVDVAPLAAAKAAQLVLLDLHMPGLSGFEVMTAIQEAVPAERRPQIVVLTGDLTVEVRHRSLAGGAADFLTKPLDALEVQLRVRNLLRMRSMQVALRQHTERLEELVRERTAELDRTQIEILERLARAAEHRDDATGQHTRRVADLSGDLALLLGVETAEAELIRRAAMLHDVGKIGVPDALLLKPGGLTDGELRYMQRHTSMGAAILSGSDVRLLQIAEQIARSHHERWDGNGYPDGLAGSAIPLPARIVAVADAFDAITSERPYQPARPPALALAEIIKHAATQFDPAVVAALRQRLAGRARRPSGLHVTSGT